jgi:hypothetical protein
MFAHVEGSVLRMACLKHSNTNSPYFVNLMFSWAGLSGRATKGLGLRPLACWDCGFESRRRNGCLSLVSVVCCQVEVSAEGWSCVQRRHKECGVCVIDEPQRGDWGPLDLSNHEKKCFHEPMSAQPCTGTCCGMITESVKCLWEHGRKYCCSQIQNRQQVSVPLSNSGSFQALLISVEPLWLNLNFREPAVKLNCPFWMQNSNKTRRQNEINEYGKSRNLLNVRICLLPVR